MKIDIKPLSINAAFKGRRYRTDKYNKYERDILLQLKPMNIPDGKLEISIMAGFSYKGADLDNVAKLFIDILQKKYGFNDSRIYALTMLKRIVPKGQEFISFSIFECLKDG